MAVSREHAGLLRIEMGDEAVGVGERLRVSFHRTLRLPDDGRAYPLPPGLGRLPIARLTDATGRLCLAVPLHPREALWIGFTGAPWKPNAVKVLVGGLNAITGLADEGAPPGDRADYLVCPPQPWLDGFNLGDGLVRQFVAMPLGQGYAAEASFGLAEKGGLEIVVFEPRPGRFPDAPPAPDPARPQRFRRPAAIDDAAMGLAAGGRMRQKIYPDPYGADIWDAGETGRVRLTLVNGAQWQALTGRPPPPTPIDAATYAAHGLPWFDLFDEDAATLASARGATIRTIRARDAERGATIDDPAPDGGTPLPIIRIRPHPPAPARGQAESAARDHDQEGGAT